jgi:hypothetical protein
MRAWLGAIFEGDFADTCPEKITLVSILPK